VPPCRRGRGRTTSSGPAGCERRRLASAGNCLIRAISPESDGRTGYGARKAKATARGIVGGGGEEGRRARARWGDPTRDGDRALAGGRARPVGWCQQRGSVVPVACQHVARGSIDAADVRACMGAAVCSIGTQQHIEVDILT
jgi:hypothetical protein